MIAVSRKMVKISLISSISLIVLLLALNLLMPTNAEKIHKQNKQKIIETANVTKSLAAQMDTIPNKVVDYGIDNGCNIEANHEILGFTNYIDCRYTYYSYHTGNGSFTKKTGFESMKNDVLKLHNLIKEAGWDVSGSSEVRYQSFLQDPSYTAFPLSYDRSSTVTNPYDQHVDINLFDLSNVNKLYSDDYLFTLANSNLTEGKYMFGISINFSYHNGSCLNIRCKANIE